MKNKEAIEKILQEIEKKYTLIIEEREEQLDDGSVDFYIKECKGWLFGLWSFTEEDKEVQEVQYFCQYEQDINKFKPSESNICKKITVYTYEDNNNRADTSVIYMDYIMNSIELIRKHPLRAWYENYYGAMCNCQYMSGAKILSHWVQYKFNRTKRQFIVSLCDKLTIKFVKKFICPYIYLDEDDEYVFIDDYGASCSPRYEVCVKTTGQTGAYAWFEDDEDGQKIKSKWDKFTIRMKKLTRLFNVVWYPPFNEIVFYTNKESSNEQTSKM